MDGQVVDDHYVFGTTSILHCAPLHGKKQWYDMRYKRNSKCNPNKTADILFFIFHAFKHKFQPGNVFFWIQHISIRLKSKVTNFYLKMPMGVRIPDYPSRPLFTISKEWYVVQ